MAEGEQGGTCFGWPMPDPTGDALAEIDPTNAVLVDLIGKEDEQEVRRGVRSHLSGARVASCLRDRIEDL